MKKLMIAAACALSLTGFAAKKAPVEEPLLIKPNSAKGFIAVINAQDKVAKGEFDLIIKGFNARKPYEFRFVKTDDEAKGAAATVRIVDKPGEPPMTVWPEIGRSEVNVAGLVDDLKSESAKAKFFPIRARREFMRGLAYACGAGLSQFPGNSMAISAIKDLDYTQDLLPFDTLKAMEKVAKTRGLVPARAVDYYTACKEGWAPAPTNETQKADWDEVHSIPEKPMQIKFDPAAKKGTVTK